MLAARRLVARPLLSVATRRIHVTPRCYAAAEPPDLSEMMNDPKVRETFEKLGRHPPAIMAMQKVGEIIKSKGFEPGKPPSKMDMIKLMMNKDFRDAAQTLTTEMQNAGVEINPDIFMKMMEADKSK